MTQRQRNLDGRSWDEAEKALMRRFYTRRGAAYVHTKLHEKGYTDRTLIAVLRAARRLKLRYAPSEGKRPLVYLADALPTRRQRCGHEQAHPTIVKAAEADGVLSRAPTYPYAAMAPEDWVDAFMERFSTRLRRIEWLRDNWITTAQLSELFGVTHKTMTDYMGSCGRSRGKTVQAHLDRIPSELVQAGYSTGIANTRFWEPEASRLEAAKYRRLRDSGELDRVQRFGKHRSPVTSRG